MDPKAFIQFCQGLEQRIHSVFGPLLNSVAAQEQTVISKQSYALAQSFDYPELSGCEIRVKYPKLFSKRNLIKYSVLSWWLTPIAKFELQEILQKKAIQLHFPEIQSYLYSRECMMASLFLENDLKHEDLFGNLLTNGIYENIVDTNGKHKRLHKSDFVTLYLQFRKKPNAKVFRRGYNDHGSMADPDKKAIRDEEYIELSTKQYELELQRTKESLLSKTLINEMLIFLNELEGIDK